MSATKQIIIHMAEKNDSKIHASVFLVAKTPLRQFAGMVFHLESPIFEQIMPT
jgi:hypothetical protein